MVRLTRKVQGPATPHSTLTLPLALRVKSRLRARLDNGAEAGVFLDRGSTLREGDLLATDDGFTVLVRAAAEKLSTVVCDSALLLARASYHLGNRHVALQIAPGRLSYQHDPVLDDMLRGMGLEVTVEDAPFEPEPGAYGGHHHPDGHPHQHR
jgi:urease accessory protein